MEEDRRKGGICRKKTRSIIWICICAALMLAGCTVASPDDTQTRVTETITITTTTSSSSSSSSSSNINSSATLVTEETLPTSSSSERTSNAIPEAEEATLEALKKYATKKSESGFDQLEKPYPYLKSQTQSTSKKAVAAANAAAAAVAAADRLDNDIRQSKRSGKPELVGGVNVTSTTETDIGTSTQTTVATTIDGESSTDAATTFATTATTVDEVQSTHPPTDNTQTTAAKVISVSEEKATVSNELVYTEVVSSTVESTVPVTLPTLTTISSTSQPEELITQVTDEPTTTTESTTFTLKDEPSTTGTEEEPTTIIPTIVTVATTASTTTTSARPKLTTPAVTLTTFLTTPAMPITLTTTPNATAMTTEPTIMARTPLPVSTAPSTMFTSTTTSTTTTTPTPTTTSTTTTTTTTPSTTTSTTSTTTTTTIPSTTATSTTEAPIVIEISSTPEMKTVPTATTALSTTSSGGRMLTTNTEAFNPVNTWPDEVTEITTDTTSPTLPTEDISILIRIVFEGTWHDICSKLTLLRQSLADLVNNSVQEKNISPGQIIFHQTQCSDNLTPTSLMSEVPLTPVLVYVVDENGNFDGALTKILPNLYQMTSIEFPLTIHSFVLVPEADSGNAIAVVIVSCVAFICLILLAGLLFLMRRRQGRFNYGERCRPVSLDAYSLDSVSAYNSVRRNKGVLRSSKRSYGNPTFEDSSAIPSHPLNFGGLSTFCNDANAIAEEFANIPQVSSKIDELPAGAELKNRYANVIPLPETRVPLQRLNNDPLTEYINASYVRGPKNANKYYIACQAPTESTVSDFWRMIWEQQCKVIIMLTDLVENGVEKCTEYIPPLEVSDCHRLYGDYQVTLKKREAKEKYAISTLHLKNLENNTFREVSHIWYLWPANGAPTDAAGLIAVLLEARALQRGAAGPIVVHCSPGTGRTGTLIALDLGIRQYEITRTVDVPRVVYTIRRDRAGAVQTKEQYVFVYKALNLYAGKLAGGAIEST